MILFFALFAASAAAILDDDDDTSSSNTMTSRSSESFTDRTRAPVYWREAADALIVAALASAAWSKVDASFDSYDNLGPAVYLAGDAKQKYIHAKDEKDFNGDTRTLIASASKLLSALAIVRLIQAGELELNATVGQFVDWWAPANSSDPRGAVTLEQTLAFTSGCSGNTTTCTGNFDNKDPSTTEECAKTIYNDPRYWPYTPPGKFYNYDSCHMLFSALMVEKAVGKPWSEIFYEQVLKPLDLPRDAIVYELWTPDRPMLAGGVRTSANIYATVLRAVFSDDSFVSPATRQWWFKSHTNGTTVGYSPMPTWAYALGCWVEGNGVFSSLGAFGFYPALKFGASGASYWLVVGQNVLDDIIGLAVGAIVGIVVAVCICCACCIAVAVFVAIKRR